MSVFWRPSWCALSRWLPVGQHTSESDSSPEKPTYRHPNPNLTVFRTRTIVNSYFTFYTGSQQPGVDYVVRQHQPYQSVTNRQPDAQCYYMFSSITICFYSGYCTKTLDLKCIYHCYQFTTTHLYFGKAVVLVAHAAIEQCTLTM